MKERETVGQGFHENHLFSVQACSLEGQGCSTTDRWPPGEEAYYLGHCSSSGMSATPETLARGSPLSVLQSLRQQEHKQSLVLLSACSYITCSGVILSRCCVLTCSPLLALPVSLATFSFSGERSKTTSKDSQVL